MVSWTRANSPLGQVGQGNPGMVVKKAESVFQSICKGKSSWNLGLSLAWLLFLHSGKSGNHLSPERNIT